MDECKPLVLGQDTAFDSLHWFDSVKEHYAEEGARQGGS